MDLLAQPNLNLTQLRYPFLVTGLLIFQINNAYIFKILILLPFLTLVYSTSKKIIMQLSSALPRQLEIVSYIALFHFASILYQLQTFLESQLCPSTICNGFS